jgi:hypothetical protein
MNSHFKCSRLALLSFKGSNLNFTMTNKPVAFCLDIHSNSSHKHFIVIQRILKYLLCKCVPAKKKEKGGKKRNATKSFKGTLCHVQKIYHTGREMHTAR